MKALLTTMLVVAAAGPLSGAKPTSARNEAGTAGSEQSAAQSQEQRAKDQAAAILEARQKAVDDIRAGKPAPYYFAAPVAPASLPDKGERAD